MATVPLDHIASRADPIGALAAWTLAPLVGALAVGYAIVHCATHVAEIVHPGVAAVAVGALVAAAVALAVAAHPSIARLSRATAIIITALTVLAAVLSAVSTWDHNRLIQDDWGQVGIGLLVFGMLWLRPPLELIVLGTLGALAVGVLAADQVGTLHIRNTPFVYAVVAATPVLVLTAVAATCATIIGRLAETWSASALAGMAGLEPELRQVEESSLHSALVTELRSATLPLLASVVARGSVTAGDIEAAERLAALLREQAIEQLSVTWLDRLGDATGVRSAQVRDPERLAQHLPASERAAISACMIESVRLGLVDPASTTIMAVRAPTARSSERAVFEVTFRTLADPRRLRRTVAPFFSVLRSLSGDATCTRSANTMTVRFGFDPA